jgi:hypothetical protein
MAGGKGKISGADGKPFVKDDPRINRKGAPPKLPELDVILAEVFTEKERIDLLRTLLKEALKGNVRAIEILLDRIYGKVKQQTELSGSIITAPITGIQIILDDSKT